MNNTVLTVTLNPCIDKTSDIESFEFGGLNRVLSSRYDAGGKGINVSRALENFGIDTLACGFIAGAQGNFLKSCLDAENVRYSFTEVPGETRVNIKLYDRKSHITTEVSEPGFLVNDDDMKDFLLSFEEKLDKSGYLVLGGSTAPGIDSGIYGDLIACAKAKGVKVFLDADGERFKKGVKAVPFAVKPNLFELEQYCGMKLDTPQKLSDAMRELIDTGIELVIVSMGADGAVFMNNTEKYKTVPFAIDCKSTVGAGDTMVAAVLYSVINGFSLEKTAMLATAAGTLTSAKEGTQICGLNELMASYTKIQVQRF